MTFLLVLAAVYFGFRILFRYVLPGVIARKVKDVQDQMVQQQRDFEQAQNPKQEGETEIIRDTDASDSIDDRPKFDDEDYIEFEEVE